MYKNYVAPYFPDLSPRCLRTATCLYTNTSDNNFVIDAHPDYPAVLLASPCSGHGFKYSAAIGEVLAELILDGKSKLDMSQFGITRLLK